MAKQGSKRKAARHTYSRPTILVGKESEVRAKLLSSTDFFDEDDPTDSGNLDEVVVKINQEKEGDAKVDEAAHQRGERNQCSREVDFGKQL